MNRPPIPRPMERQVLVEAGHRCAIPTCRQTPVEIAHIVSWAQMQEHTFENLIALCPTCHTRYDKGDIDKLSMLRYKANLTIINGRYGDLERRVLQYFVDDPLRQHIVLFGGLEFLLTYLIKDELIYDTGLGRGVGMGGDFGEVESEKVYALTEHGKAFVAKWMAAQELE